MSLRFRLRLRRSGFSSTRSNFRASTSSSLTSAPLAISVSLSAMAPACGSLSAGISSTLLPSASADLAAISAGTFGAVLIGPSYFQVSPRANAVWSASLCGQTMKAILTLDANRLARAGSYEVTRSFLALAVSRDLLPIFGSGSRLKDKTPLASLCQKTPHHRSLLRLFGLALGCCARD